MYSAVLDSERAGGPARAATEFWNYGHWDASTQDHLHASRRLLDELLSRLPPDATAVLDVAIGKGASTLALCRRFGSGAITGIDIGDAQLQAARERGVSCALRIMDAARMSFPAEHFDCVLCVEGAFHFRSRQDFLSSVYRILRPGGRLVMSDVLFRSGYGLDPEAFPVENQIGSLDAYRTLFTNAGFVADRVTIEQTTEKQIVPYLMRQAEHLGLLQTAIDGPRELSAEDRWRIWFLTTRLLNVRDCAIVCAEK